MKTLIYHFITIYDAIIARFGWPQDILLLFVRVAWGFAFFQAGSGKLNNLEGVTAFFTELGIPAPGLHALLVGGVECFGGLLLMAGLFSRLAALPLAISMIVAYLTADIDAVKTLFTEDWTKFLEAAPGPYLLASLLILFFGPGRLSLDALLVRLCRCRATSCGSAS